MATSAALSQANERGSLLVGERIFDSFGAEWEELKQRLKGGFYADLRNRRNSFKPGNFGWELEVLCNEQGLNKNGHAHGRWRYSEHGPQLAQRSSGEWDEEFGYGVVEDNAGNCFPLESGCFSRASEKIELRLKLLQKCGERFISSNGKKKRAFLIVPTLCGVSPVADHNTVKHGMNRQKARYCQIDKNLKIWNGSKARPLLIDPEQRVEKLHLNKTTYDLAAVFAGLQLHLEGPIDNIGGWYNLAWSLLAPFVALGANSHYFMGKLPWHCTRHPIWGACLGRGSSNEPVFPLPKTFLKPKDPLALMDWVEGYIRGGRPNFVSFKRDKEEEQAEKKRKAAGQPDPLFHIGRYISTIWEPIRLLLGMEPRPNARVEFRGFCTPPTLIDIECLMKALTGAMWHYASVDEWGDGLVKAEDRVPNYLAACKSGLYSSLWWGGGRRRKKIRVKAILDEILERASEGLVQFGIADAEEAEYCIRVLKGCYRAIEVNGLQSRKQNGAIWTARQVQALRGKHSKDEGRIQQYVLKAMLENSCMLPGMSPEDALPVCLWPDIVKK